MAVRRSIISSYSSTWNCPSMKWMSSWNRSSVAMAAQIAFRAGGGGSRIAIWIALKPPQEMPHIPTLPLDQG
jgi:hypothetical protein